MGLRQLLLIGLLLGIGTLLPAATDALPTPELLPGSGAYTRTVEVRLRAAGAEAIFYTLDGSTPGPRSLRYRDPLVLYQTTVVRAVAYRAGRVGTEAGATYWINEPPTALPVVSIAIDPGTLFDPHRGLLVAGPQTRQHNWKLPGANFWSHDEFAAHVDIVAPDGDSIFSGKLGLRLFGGISRLFAQKSFSLSARKTYSAKSIDYPLFGEQGPDRVRYLVLRNSGSDWGRSQFRDGLMHTLVANWDIEQQGFQPALVYLNGSYWGLYNLREKINRTYLADHHREVNRDSLDLLEHYATRKHGSNRRYLQLLQFLQTSSLRDRAALARLYDEVDVDNFINYQIAQIYGDNRDAGGNIRYWRPWGEDGRWRWILFDTDQCFGLHDAQAYAHNSLAFHLADDGPKWPNPPWSTFLLRKLLEDENLRRIFINRLADHLNLTFHPERVVHTIDSLASILRPEMPRHQRRWRINERTWLTQVNIMRRFAQERPAYLRRFVQEQFAVGPERRLLLEVAGGGSVLLNDYTSVHRHLDGIYFRNLPVRLRAVPRHGHRFVRWEVAGLSDAYPQREIELKLRSAQPYRIRAVFEPYQHPLQDALVINEICPYSAASGDWVELYNGSRTDVNLEDWVLTDFRHEHRLPAVRVPAGDFVVICRDLERFRRAYPSAHNVVGGLSFGLRRRGESLGLYSQDWAAVDSVHYRLPRSDTSLVVGLLRPGLDNTVADNWHSYVGPGTPDGSNPAYLRSSIQPLQQRWTRFGLLLGLTVLLLTWILRRSGVE